jgi:hypothetical protein
MSETELTAVRSRLVFTVSCDECEYPQADAEQCPKFTVCSGLNSWGTDGNPHCD